MNVLVAATCRGGPASGFSLGAIFFEEGKFWKSCTPASQLSLNHRRCVSQVEKNLFFPSQCVTVMGTPGGIAVHCFFCQRA